MKRAHKAILAAAAAACVAVAAVFAWQRALGPRVTVVRASRHELVQTVVVSGRVLPPAEINLGSVITGVVRTVGARVGSRVRAGDALVAFDNAEIVAQVAQARAGVLQAAARVGQVRLVSSRVTRESLRQAASNLRAAEDALARQRHLFEAGAVAAADLDAAQRAAEVARSQLETATLQVRAASAGGSDARLAVAGRAQAEATLRASEARMEQTVVRAPVGGVVVRRDVEPGDVVQAARTMMVLLADGETEITAAPDERTLATLREGQRATVSAEAFPERAFPAVVTYIAPAIDPQRGTVEVRLRVPDPPEYLRAHMTVSVNIEVARNEHALVLPVDALHDASTGIPWVLTVGADGTTFRREVRVGLRGGNLVEVVAGLRDGDGVLAGAGAAAVRAGQRVRAQWPGETAARGGVTARR